MLYFEYELIFDIFVGCYTFVLIEIMCDYSVAAERQEIQNKKNHFVVVLFFMFGKTPD